MTRHASESLHVHTWQGLASAMSAVVVATAVFKGKLCVLASTSSGFGLV